MPGQPAELIRPAAWSRVRGHRSRTRRMVGGVLVDTGPLRRHRTSGGCGVGQLVSQIGTQLTVVAV